MSGARYLVAAISGIAANAKSTETSPSNRALKSAKLEDSLVKEVYLEKIRKHKGIRSV